MDYKISMCWVRDFCFSLKEWDFSFNATSIELQSIRNHFQGIIWGKAIQVPSVHVAPNFWEVLCLKLLVSGQTFILLRYFYIILFAVCLHFFLLLSLTVILSAWHWSEIHVFHVGVEVGLEAHSCISELHSNDKDWVICKVLLDSGFFQDA